MNQKNLFEVDWSKIPPPTDDGAAAHLVGMAVPPIGLAATDDTTVTLSALTGRSVVFAYPRTGEPGKISVVDDWDMIPGARGCTPHTCAFRDLFAELKAAGAAHVFGLSTQSNAYQLEMALRLHLPFAVLSDEKLALIRALNLPTMEVAGLILIKRLALIIDDARITHVFYPVFPPDRNAGDVLEWLKENRRWTGSVQHLALKACSRPGGSVTCLPDCSRWHKADITGGRVNVRRHGKRPSNQSKAEGKQRPQPGGEPGWGRVERRGSGGRRCVHRHAITWNLFALFNIAHVAEKNGVIHGKISR